MDAVVKKTSADYSREWRARNPERSRDHQRKWRLANQEKMKAARDAWRKAHPTHQRTLEAGWRLRNRDHIAIRKAKRRMTDPSVLPMHAQWSAERRARQRQATPAWANRFFIAEAYRLAALRTNLTGIKWHVDHIVPIVSDKVCGLHVESNLRVITGRENQSKNNHHWPDMPK